MLDSGENSNRDKNADTKSMVERTTLFSGGQYPERKLFSGGEDQRGEWVVREKENSIDCTLNRSSDLNDQS
jgi:hypothetical protein